jgi:hypothetical protein
MSVKAFSADATKTALDVETTAIGAENTDGEFAIGLLGAPEAGGWSTGAAGGIHALNRTPAAATESYWIPVNLGSRTTSSKGIKPTGLTVNYSVGTADATDVRFEIWKLTQGADGAAPTAAVLFGEDNADYDANHDSTTKRGDDTAAPELHKATLIDAGTPAYMAAGEALVLRVFVIDPGTAQVIVQSAVLQYSETLVDLT